ncbi:MAG TPA: TetR/AcrR family transcriptional regulator [Streptosporangiaceae bacterium]
MNQMVQLLMAPSQAQPSSGARERLLAAAVEHALSGGITGQSLREIAAAVGTSHRMLLYHFGSREGLLVAISNTVNEAEAATLARWRDPWALWAHYSDPELRSRERLFFELYANALYARPGSEGFFEASVEAWLSALTAQLVDAGTKPEEARVQARLGLAVTRGLLLDLLATGDEDGVTRAFAHYLRSAAAHPAPGRTGELIMPDIQERTTRRPRGPDLNHKG